MRNRITLGKIEREIEKFSPDEKLKLLETYSSDKEGGRERCKRCKKGSLAGTNFMDLAKGYGEAKMLKNMLTV